MARMSDRKFRKLPAEHAANCQNCNWQGHYEDLAPISHIHERTEEGDTVWAGDCPECGAMAFTVAEIERQQAPDKERDAILDALEDLMQYVGGWDSAPDHPCGKARDLLAKYKRPKA